MSDFWSRFDDDDPVPVPGAPYRVGDARRDRKLEVRAVVWSFLDVKAMAAMREAYARAMTVPDITDEERIRILAKATVGVGLAVLDKFEEVDKARRTLGAKARAAKIEAEQEERWGGPVRALLGEDGARSAHRLSLLLHANKAVKSPPTKGEQSTFERYVRRVKAESKFRHTLSE